MVGTHKFCDTKRIANLRLVVITARINVWRIRDDLYCYPFRTRFALASLVNRSTMYLLKPPQEQNSCDKVQFGHPGQCKLTFSQFPLPLEAHKDMRFNLEVWKSL